MKRILIAISLILSLAGCSSVKLLEGEYALSKSTVVMEKRPGLNVSDLNPYVRSAKKYSNSIVTQSEENMVNHLHYLGYYHPEITSKTDFKGKKAKVTYYVDPGSQIDIDSVFFHLPRSDEFASDFYSDTMNVTVAPGKMLSEKSLDAERTRSASAMRNLGYFDFSKNNYSFMADTVRYEGNVSLHYNVRSEDNLTKYRIGDVRLYLPEELKFNDKVLKELITVRSGDLYSEKKTDVTYSRLSALRVFNSVNIEMTPKDSAVVDCNIIMNAGKQQGMKFNLEASTNANGLLGISPQISYYNKNLFHGGEWLNVSFKGNFQFKLDNSARATETGLSATLSLPRFLGVPTSKIDGAAIPRTDFSGSIAYQDRPEYNRITTSFKYGYSGKFDKESRVFVTYSLSPFRLNIVRMFSMSDEFYATILDNPLLWYSYSDHLDAGVSASIRFSSSKDVFPKTDYRYITLGASLSGNVISLFNGLMPLNDYGERTIFNVPYSQYAKFDVNMGKTWRLGGNEKGAFATHFVFGIGKAYGNSTTMPYEEQFYCGGANSMRAWQARSLGPGAEPMIETLVIPSQTGDVKLELDAEFRFPIVWKLEGAAFLETGNVWTIPDKDASPSDYKGYFYFKDFYKSLAADWGLGIRLNMDFLVIRVDGGFKLREPCREQPWLSPGDWFKKNGFAVHFGVGYPF